MSNEPISTGRRGFLSGTGKGLLTGAGVSLAAAGAMLPASAARAQSVDPSDVLNFALNLEYLEAEFYLRAAFGRGLRDEDTTGEGTRGSVTGGTRVPFTTPFVRRFAEEVAIDEQAHVRFLRAGLGDDAVARPAINLSTAFTAAARAAGLIQGGQTFNPFADENSFLLAVFLFEDVGVSAYQGAAEFLADTDFLTPAAGILAVEAYHAAVARTLLIQRNLGQAAFRISNLRDGADRDEDSDQGVGGNGRNNLVPTDRNALTFPRTPDEVLNIVYLGGENANFGFFPNRLNGELR